MKQKNTHVASFFFFVTVMIISFALPRVFLFILFLVKQDNTNTIVNSMLNRFSNEFGHKGSNHNFSNNMSDDEALKVLGLNQKASHSEINNAHHDLMKLLHLDKGGSEYFAQKINKARDGILKGYVPFSVYCM